MFNNKYDADKNIIMEPIAEFQQQMNTRVAIEVQFHKQKTIMAITILFVLSGIITMAIVLWIFRVQLSIPITGYIKTLQNNYSSDCALKPTGTK